MVKLKEFERAKAMQPDTIGRTLLLFLCFLIVAEGLSWWTSLGPGPCLIQQEIHEQTAGDNKQEGCPTFYAGSEILMYRLNHFIEIHDKSIVAIFTIVLAASTIGLWLATIGLYRAGQREIEHLERAVETQSRDMQASIKVGQDSAKAAARSADLAERAVILTDRPWVEIAVELAGPLILTADECTVKITIRLKNHGRSPGIKTGFFLEFCASSDAAIDQETKIIRTIKMTGGLISFGRTMFPGATREYSYPISFDRAAIEAARDSEDKHVRPYIVAFAYYGLPTGRKIPIHLPYARSCSD